jgi:hypothetical protein
MNLSQNPESICVHLEVPFEVALDFTGGPEDVGSRHEVERLMQNYFFGLEMPDYVHGGDGAVMAGNIFIHTDRPAVTLRELNRFFRSFPVRHNQTDMRAYVHFAWLDRQDKIWRTFHPRTTRPFWTFLADPTQLAEILEKGRAVKA